MESVKPIAEDEVAGCVEAERDRKRLTCPIERHAKGLLNFGSIQISGGPLWGEGLRHIQCGDIELVLLADFQQRTHWK